MPTGYSSAETPVSSATNSPQLFRLCCDGSNTAASSPTSAGGCVSPVSGCCSCCAALQRIAGCCCCWAGCQGLSAAGRPASGTGAFSPSVRRGAALDGCTFCALKLLEAVQRCIVAAKRRTQSSVQFRSGRTRPVLSTNWRSTATCSEPDGPSAKGPHPAANARLAAVRSAPQRRPLCSTAQQTGKHSLRCNLA